MNAPSPSPRTFQVGLIGDGIQKSRTPPMHVAEGAAQGFDLCYDLIDTGTMDPVPPLAQLLDRAQDAGFAGLNITFPYKKEVLAHLDTLSDSVTKLGAANTVVFRDGKRFGHNTDFWGFAEGLRQRLPDAEKDCVLLLGAGGAGGAVGHALVDQGVQRLLVVDRDPAMAQALVDSINRFTPGRAEVARDVTQAAAQAQGIVNATPMGMAKLPGTAIDTALIDPRHWVGDIVYFPMETALLAAARAKGCRTMSGAGMAVFQAVRAFELFTGQPADAARMRATFESIAP
ncbi:shikimate dehydrogenase [Tropicibacter naphthalenivorans]|uniref:shikimate dehydrogenase (NADP(+)) n=1 Tax=Tropicibacter naphthalenivorans TaxID=441103 RepID=A0A0P1GCI8_9RHOB|nr:shikimate dehydrogenase [Tropicibacter naphthalenivorans]CUH79076.1 Quinate/shikimate dehydrogenase [Tropicibacter naphthalenivorans]SMD03614.1 shikimate dehydrogenase [Tropicibacter naphthalenivorans]